MMLSVCKRRPSARIFSLILAAVIAFVFISSDARSTVTAADETVYISEVMLFYGYDLNDAINECKKAGYIPLERDLNESAYENQSSSVKNHTTSVLKEIYGEMGSAVVLGYKTTMEREEAVTNLAMLNMGLGYDTYNYEEYMKLQSGKFSFMAKTITGLRDEVKANVEKKSPAAEMALRLMNYYRYDEKNMLLGDYILSDSCKAEDLSYLFQHTNPMLVNTVFSAMTAGVADYNPDTVFTEGSYTKEVEPAEVIPDTELPELPEEEELTDEESSQAEETPSEEESSQTEEASSEE